MKLRRSTVALTTAVLVLSACASRLDEAPPPGAAAPTTGSTPASSPARVDNQSPPEPRTGPPRADIGADHPFDLLAHCGVTHAVFAGRTWKVEQPVADPPGEPLARGSINYLPGTMRLTAADRLRFTVDAGSQVLPGAVVTFTPTAEQPPPCQ